MKAFFLFFGIVWFNLNAYGQANDTTYFNKLGVWLDSTQKDQAEYYEIIGEKRRDGVSMLYYMDGTKYGEILYASDKRNGPYILFYKNGQQRERGYFDNDYVSGRIETWYENGQKKKVTDFHSEPNFREEKMIHAWDSLGKVQVEGGDGYYSGSEYEFPEIWEEGNYTNGLRTGDWTGHRNDTLYYRETYQENGEFISGISYDKEGNEFKYDIVEKTPSYPGDYKGWTKYLKKSLKYPKQARRKGVQGRVFLSFVVDKDGSVTNARVVRGIGYGCDAEALRIIRESINWNPGTQRGQAVKSRMAIQIIFRLR